ncbi:HEPN domain-containing protein [Helcococcus kunzii]|uniref:ApeA N-terminal domain 1-containing protein n=1 Tax=Helcococcus kunzii TaxID=40091 RepID=UPI00389D7326
MNNDIFGSGYAVINDIRYKCELNENGYDKEYLKIYVPRDRSDEIKSNFDIECIKVKLLNGMVYTLLYPSVVSSSRGVLSDFVQFVYTAEILIKNIYQDKKDNILLEKIDFKVSGILDWGGLNCYEISDGKLGHVEQTSIKIYKTRDFEINYYLLCSSLSPLMFMPNVKEEINLKQIPNFSIKFSKAQNIDSFFDIIYKLKKLIILCKLENINIKEIHSYLEDEENAYNYYPIEIFLRNKHINEKKNSFFGYKFIGLNQLIDNDSIKKFFSIYDKIEPIINLYIEILYSKDISLEQLFLNVVQALETYHSRFVCDNIKEFVIKVDSIVEEVAEFNKESLRKFLLPNSNRKYILLESRIADLVYYSKNIFYFRIQGIHQLDFPSIIATSRNYYTHYNESLLKTGKVLQGDALLKQTYKLLEILDHYILLELGFKDEENIKKITRGRWGIESERFLI